jgi:hypothetical protein
LFSGQPSKRAISSRAKGTLDLAATQAKVEGDVGFAAAGEMLEIGEGAGGLEHIVHDDRRCHGRHFVEDGGKLFILCLDELERALGHVRILGEHDRHGLPDMAHLLVRKNGLVVKGRSVIRICNELDDVLDCDDTMDTSQFSRGTRLDPADAAVGNGAAENFSMQHAGKTQILQILRASRHLGAPFDARNAAADLSHGACAASLPLVRQDVIRNLRARPDPDVGR